MYTNAEYGNEEMQSETKSNIRSQIYKKSCLNRILRATEIKYKKIFENKYGKLLKVKGLLSIDENETKLASRYTTLHDGNMFYQNLIEKSEHKELLRTCSF
ncbi:hypothetical protein OAB57_01030 [Bacteriovoracaceae bacterium]|nr:hypothetical protein [Bacteriovoracaceae bacterium]